MMAKTTKQTWALDPRFPYRIFFTKEDYIAFCKRNDLGLSEYLTDTTASAMTIPYPGKNLSVVYFNQPVRKKIPQDHINTLVHEATHVVDNVFEWAGEKMPGKETRAYLMSQVVDEFMLQYSAFYTVSKT